MQLLAILVGLLLGLYVFRRWSAQAGPTRTAQVLRQFAMLGGAVLLIVLIMRGGPAALALLPLLLPMLLRGRDFWKRLAPATTAGGPGNSRSTVETRFLNMALDHASGEMWGKVLEGRFAGHELQELTLNELLDLWRECRVDAQSAAVLESYLDRTIGDEWREQAHHREEDSPSSDSPMSRQEAYDILGLQAGASHEEIKTAHRRLMQRVHPDHGGSTYLAARINQAKDLLLGN